MSKSIPLVDHSRQTSRQLEDAVKLWLQSLGKRTPRPDLNFTLPTESLQRTWIDLYQIRARIPQRFVEIENPKLQASLIDHFRMIEISCLATNSPLLRGLTHLAFERASYQILFDETDTFEVSPWSICYVSAFLNLTVLLNKVQLASEADCEQIAEHPLDLQKQVSRPLRLAEKFESRLAPGDLWIADLVAATTLQKIPSLIQQEVNPLKKRVLQTILPGLLIQFISGSTTQKLLSSHHLPEPLFIHLNLKQWCGTDVLLQHPGATGLRTLVAIESTRLLSTAMNPRWVETFGSYLKYLSQTEDLALPDRQRFVSNLLLDWLSIEKSALQRFTDSPAGRQILIVCVQLIEKHAEEHCPFEMQDPFYRTRQTLRTIPTYHDIRMLQEELTAAANQANTYPIMNSE